MSIYKPCDIRGNTEDELDASLYRIWGRALGERLPAGAPFVIGGDVRRSTPAFLDACIEGLIDAGMRVRNLGTVPTPMVYFARRHTGAAGCAIVTASHSPPDVNGLKWMIGDRPPDEKEVTALERTVESGRPTDRDRPMGERMDVDIDTPYVTWLQDSFADLKDTATIHRVVLDPGGGTWSRRALDFSRRVFGDLEFAAIHDEEDGQFTRRHPDSARPAHLNRLVDRVLEDEADVGAAFDADGDRISFVDNEGQVLTPEQATIILLRSFADEWSGRHFIHDVKFSDRVPMAGRGLGARPLAQRSGHAFIRSSMMDQEALFGAEISGHYFYEALDGGDDALFSLYLMIRFLGQCGRPLAYLRRSCPDVFMTSDLRLAVPPHEQDDWIATIRSAFDDHPQSFVDGVRINFDEGWTLVRKSVTEAKLTFRFEAGSDAELKHLVSRFSERVPTLGPALLHQIYAERPSGT